MGIKARKRVKIKKCNKSNDGTIILNEKHGAYEFKLPLLSTGGSFLSFARRHSDLQVAASHDMLSTQQTVQEADRPTRLRMHATPASYLSQHDYTTHEIPLEGRTRDTAAEERTQ